MVIFFLLLFMLPLCGVLCISNRTQCHCRSVFRESFCACVLFCHRVSCLLKKIKLRILFHINGSMYRHTATHTAHDLVSGAIPQHRSNYPKYDTACHRDISTVDRVIFGIRGSRIDRVLLLLPPPQSLRCHWNKSIDGGKHRCCPVCTMHSQVARGDDVARLTYSFIRA